MVAVLRNKDHVKAEIAKVIVGHSSIIDATLIAMLSNGHVLLEGVPGVAKTMLARALARSINANFKRIQCTPDLLPGDITGVNVFNQKTCFQHIEGHQNEPTE